MKHSQHVERNTDNKVCIMKHSQHVDQNAHGVLDSTTLCGRISEKSCAVIGNN